MRQDEDLTARMEPFDSFWEAPKDIERGYSRFGKFYRRNYLPHLPTDRNAEILVISCGPGYFVEALKLAGYDHVLGIDSMSEKVEIARRRQLNCKAARAFGFLQGRQGAYDAIVAEQELNHLTKEEILDFLDLCKASLRPGGRLLIHAINGANPITGSESRAGNFDHYCSFTEYSLAQVLEFKELESVQVFPLQLYVFYLNPLNYVAWAIDRCYSLFFRLNFMLVGKSARIFTKKIGAVARMPVAAREPGDGGNSAAR